MSYGAGRSLLYKEYGEEKAAEAKRYHDEVAAIDAKRQKESTAKGIWSSVGKIVLGAIFGPPGMIAGDAIGTTAADLAYDWEDMRVTTDPGRFEQTQQYDLEQTNIDYAAQNEADFWKDLTGVGTTAALGWRLAGGTFEDPFALESGGLRTWGGTGSVWDQLFPPEDQDIGRYQSGVV